MMTCKELQDRLVDLRLGELPLRVRLALGFHARFCDCCRALIQTYGLTADLAADLAGQPISPEVHADLERILAEVLDRDVHPG